MRRLTLGMSIAAALLVVMSLTAWAYEPAVHDFGGRTVVFAGHNQGMPPVGSPAWDRLQEAQERFNVKVEFRFISQEEVLAQALTAVVAGDPTYDLIQVRSADYVALATQGALIPLDEVMPQEYWESLPAPHQGRFGFKEARMIGGHTYGVPLPFGDYIGVSLIAWNPRLFANAGLASLYDLTYSGEWTWDVAREYAAKLTADTNGDGVADRWGFAGMFPTHSMHNTLLPVLATNNVELTKEVDGRVVLSLDENGKTSTMIDIIRKIGAEDRSVRPDAWNFDAFTNGQVGMFVAPLWAMESTKNENFLQGISLLPKGPEATDYTMAVPSLNQMVVPASTDEDPRALIDLWTAIYPPELIDEDVEARMTAAEDEDGFMTMYTAFTEFSLFSPYAGVLNGPNFYDPMQDVIDGKLSPAEGIAQVAPLIQAAIDDLLKQ